MEDPAAVLCASAPASVLPPPPAVAAAAEATARAPAAAAVAPPAVVAPAGAGDGGGSRRVFSVELRPGETTIVSWKKLLKEADLGAPFPHPLPALAAQPLAGPVAGPSGADEYFEVDNLATKHNGYFMNKGKLEQIEYGSVQNVAPKKRRSKDTSSSYIENNQEFASGSRSYTGSMPVKAHKRSSMQIGKNLASSNLSSYNEYHYRGNRPVKNKSNAPGRIQKMNSSDPAIDAEYAAHMKISSKDVPLPPSEIKDFDEHRIAAPQAVDFAHKFGTNETYDYPYTAYWDKDALVQLDPQLQRTFSRVNQELSKKMRRREKYDISQFSGLTTASIAYSTQTTHLATTRRIESAGTKTKGTRLERAIRDLQNIVSEYRPQTLDVHEGDPNSQAAVKRRLPQEVKQKLAKVARLSANQGKIPENELMNRLMGIVGHLVQRRTLKRNMKEMVESGLYAKQEKADRFRQVKMEIHEMIKERLDTKPKVTEQKDNSADDFQGVVNIDERRGFKGKSVMDAALENRICDLYDLYVEGMDEDKGPQSRKLYVELADLWPQGYMDKVGIRDAISRSKERRNLLYRQHKVRNEERVKRRRLTAAAKMRDGNPVVAQHARSPQVIQPPMKDTQPSMASTHTAYPVGNYGQNQVPRYTDKIGETNVVGAVSDSNQSSSTDMKRQKPESDAVDPQANPPKAVPQEHATENQKPAKHADEAKGQ